MMNDINSKSKKKIIAVSKINNVQIRNTHNNYLYPIQDVLEVDLEDGYRIIDLFSQKDITDIDYLEVVHTKKTSKKVLFESND